ncbi:hypothetical protein Zmor_000569 [Zophobas morio]|uniref:V-SNARE coiled-coil homology domain-containing protein n=1 Tax=Zophobas morio TaxID=2755281 RepID=A0AA38J6B1_9CUCU|nr:hypothetical protein Zmor_000569 [Zophobas morio]
MKKQVRSELSITLEDAQADVDEVINIMQANVEKVIQRDANLPELYAKAVALDEAGKGFVQQTHRINRKYWWKDVRVIAALGVAVVVFVTVVAVVITTSIATRAESSDATSGQASTGTSTTVSMMLKN